MIVLRILTIAFFLTSCSESSKFLKDIYRTDVSLPEMKKWDSTGTYFAKANECDSVINESLVFSIKHEEGKSLNSLYMNIYMEQKVIYSGPFKESITTMQFKQCVNKKSGNFIWFSGFDTINNIYYSWGQKNSTPLLKQYEIVLLQEKNSDEDNYIIK